LRPHFDAGRRYGEGPQLKPFGLLQIFEDRQRLMAGWIVIIDVRDLLALEAAARFVLDELDRRCALGPIGRGDREQIRKPSAVCLG
jgi:hypothetical protein